MASFGRCLDGDLPAILACLSFGARRYPKPLTEMADPVVATEADQVQSSDPRQANGVVGGLTSDL